MPNQKVMQPPKQSGRRDQVRALTLDLLNQLTTEDLRHLAEFAERRLGSLPRSRVSPEDPVQKALLSIIMGVAGNGLGRRPTSENVQSKAAFLHYVRSAINSVVEAMRRSRELLYFHESIHETQNREEGHTTIVLPSAAEADADVNMIDLKRELFKRLRKIAPRKLLPVIDEWERTFFWASHVPCRRKRDHVRQVRFLAMRVLKELSEDLGR